MKTFNKRLFIYFILLSLFVISCSSMNNKDWQSLQDRNFYFQSFSVKRKGIDNESAFKLMKSFPVDKILSLLAHKYNITIDSSEYADFVSSDFKPEFKNNSKLGLDMLLSQYEWKCVNKTPNYIELSLIFETDVQIIESVKYKILINVNGKGKEIFYNELLGDKPYIYYIASDLGYSKLNHGIGDMFVNDKTKAQIDLSKTRLSFALQGEKSNGVTTDKNSPVSEESIKLNIKQYISKMTPGNKKKFRDRIIKFLYAEIE